LRRLAGWFLLLALPGAAVADPSLLPSPTHEDAVPLKSLLSGRDIYERVLANRFDSYVQKTALVSGDRGGAEQESRLTMTWKSFRDPADDPADDSDDDPASDPGKILSKSLVKYTHPFDMRFSGYLIQNNHLRTDDQFVYLASSRRIRRVNLRSEAVFGTDFTFEDVVPQELEESTHQRLPDEMVGDVSCYAVEVVPTPEAQSQYTRFIVYVEREHFVPLRTRYWDDRGIEVKELRADPEGVREYDGIWVPTRLKMRNLQLDTFTSLRVDHLEPNPKLPRSTFDLRRLESH
jgi:hypothetical protein